MAVLPTGIGPVTGYNIERSLRFNSADSAYLNRTPASASNRKTWTWSGWVKISNPAATSAPLFTQYTDANTYFIFGFNAGALFVQMRVSSANAFVHDTDALYRDASAWYHIVYVLDTTQATDSNRAKLYVNGTQVTLTQFTSNTQWPALNTDYNVNTATSHRIGYDQPNAVYFNGYMTEVNFIDGQALTPSSFGETDTNTGVWKPKAYTGTYGTNGFFLKFADNSNTTAATLGKDYSGNGNNWTPNNFSVTAGAGNDSLVDSPTSYGTDTGVGGTVRGNYNTLNPLDSSAGHTLTNGNLDITASTTAWKNTRSTIAIPTTDKWYAEFTIAQLSAADTIMIGFSPSTLSLSTYVGGGSNSIGFQSNGTIWTNNSSGAGGTTFAATNVIQIAVDRSTGKAWLGKNGTWVSSGNPAAGTNQTTSSVATTGELFFAVSLYTTSNGVNCNFGQRAFAYTAPSGFKALCTQNLPTPTIGATSTTQANDYMNAVLWTGNASSPRAITGVGFQPDLLWIKSRSNAYDNLLMDAVRGTGNLKWISSNLTAAEGTNFNNANVTSLDSDGFTIGTTGGTNILNASGVTNVAWNWKANGAGSSNTDGTITSTVSANTTSGFSIVTYTGNGTSGATVGHGLGVAPSMIIIKVRNAADNWPVYHRSLGNTDAVFLNTTAATQALTYWNSTTPSSTVFTLGSNLIVNKSSDTFVAYCFAPVAGYSAFGSYTGNGSADGPFVYTGFRPAFVLLKSSSLAGSFWNIVDTARNSYNVINTQLYPNSSGAEGTVSVVDALSNGFKIRTTSTDFNSNTNTYIYMALAENPFKYSLAR